MFFGKISSLIARKDNENNCSQGNGKVISFLNQKGGVGKTTMAFNTAFALKEKGYKVLCIDMDPQSNLSLLFGIDDIPEYHIHHLLINSIRELKAIHAPILTTEVIIKSKHGVDIIPSGQELSGFELSVAAISMPRQLILKKFIEKNSLNEIYDYIILDCPPTLGLLVVNILCACQGVLVPFKPDEFSRKGLEHLYNVLEDIEDMDIIKTPEILTHIPNLMDKRRKQDSDDLDRISSEIESKLGDGKMVNPFFNKAQLVRAQAQKKSVFSFNSKEYLPLQSEFLKIADIISEHQYEQ